MNEETFWVAIWRTAAATLVCIVLSVGGCTAFQTTKIAEMVSSGADPIKANCAVIGIGNGNAAVCAILAAKP